MSFENEIKARKLLYQIYKVLIPFLEECNISMEYNGIVEKRGGTVVMADGVPLLLDCRVAISDFSAKESSIVLSSIFKELGGLHNPKYFVGSIEVQGDKVFIIYGVM